MATYPNGSDFEQWLSDNGLAELGTYGGARLEAVMGAAVDAFETETGWNPFLADETDSARTFYGPFGPMFEFDAALVSITSITVDGVALVAGTNYKAYPPSGEATLWLKLDQGGDEMVVTGKWGRVDALPLDVTEALYYRAWTYLDDAGMGGVHGVLRERVGDVDIQYSVTGKGESSWARAVNKWRRVGYGSA